ncbi:DNA-directed RNA polymerase III subunit Rpc5 [Macleaya cordata]|uniref:DNA-directed RNA polymerase III subunit Rpc5 n=1 Tax=Macleaya cordata TaxID=56857 RepID=A0A200Q253_MACCD|nr:DNA-directed RNA polymerase III subunit Rpc5 [Macleaya cordata]
MDLDLDDLGLGDGPSQAASRPSRFLPKSSKLKPKPKPKPEPESDADSKPLLDSIANNVTETKVEEVAKAEEEQLKEEEPMEEDIIVDQVVREIDVFFTPSPIDANTQLYILQYPLRPCWRPYELDQKCQEVRVKPNNMQVEVDLSLDVENNYDASVADNMRITKQTLSSRKVPLTTGYAVGVLVGNKLHLNPVNAVVQLRPSMEHLKPGGKKNNVTQNVEKSGQTTVEAGSSKTQSWVSLEYHGTDSIFSSRYRQKMTAQESTQIQFSMNPYDYVNSLCPGSSTEDNRTKGPSRRFFLSLPLEERFKTWLSEGPHVNRFNALKHLAPDDSNEIVLGVLQHHADLVQGLWVSKSSLLQHKGVEALTRDYVLLLFRKNALINQKKLDDSGLPKDVLKRVLIPLAVYRPTFKDWKFKEPTDLAFIKDHADIVQEQEKLWGIREKKVMETVGPGRSGPVRNSLRPSTATKSAASGKADQGAKKNVNGTPSTVTMSDETREALPKALEELLRRHKVCSLQLIRQGLRDLAVSKSALPKLHPKAAVAAGYGADAPPSELQSVISQVAINIHGVYVSKTSENPTLNPLRSVVINLFSGKEPNAKLKKADIVEAAKIILKRDISNAEYNQVVNEICVSVRGNSWVLKSGDGNEK